MLVSAATIQEILVCPRCRSKLSLPHCSNPQCALDFPVVSGQPALIDFAASIVEREALVSSSGASTLPRDPTHASFKTKVKRLFIGINKTAIEIGRRFHADVLAAAESPIVLVVGGGAFGDGALPMFHDPKVRVIGTDIYASPNTTLIADGHQLPFQSSTIDGVWIQAVLEHVLDPWKVVAEIHRVLKPNGLVFADTPFMQPVHEGPYDYTRFSLSGHRWLFRDFEMMAAGISSGPPETLNWAIRYFVQAMARSNKVGTLTSLAFFWLRPFRALMGPRWSADAAGGTFFYGRKSDRATTPRELVAFYDAQRKLKRGIIEAETAVAHPR
jgi:SAM-dependent methyltransferase